MSGVNYPKATKPALRSTTLAEAANGAILTATAMALFTVLQTIPFASKFATYVRGSASEPALGDSDQGDGERSPRSTLAKILGNTGAMGDVTVVVAM